MVVDSLHCNAMNWSFTAKIAIAAGVCLGVPWEHNLEDGSEFKQVKVV